MQHKKVSGLKEGEISSLDVGQLALTEEPHHETDQVPRDMANNQQSWGSSAPILDS